MENFRRKGRGRKRDFLERNRKLTNLSNMLSSVSSVDVLLSEFPVFASGTRRVEFVL